MVTIFANFSPHLQQVFISNYFNYDSLVGKPDHFSKTVICYKRKGYNTDVIKQSACLVVNPITVDHFAYLFNCTPEGRGSDYRMARLKKLLIR